MHYKRGKVLTRFASIEISSQGNSSIPSNWNNSDISCYNGILEEKADDRVLVFIAIEFLLEKQYVISFHTRECFYSKLHFDN